MGIQFGGFIIVLSLLLILAGMVFIAILLNTLSIIITAFVLCLIAILAFSYLINVANHNLSMCALPLCC